MIKCELILFLAVGASTVLIDFLSYRTLLEFDVVDINMAKATSFLIGTLFAYFANRFWTFAHNSPMPGSAWRFVALYASTLGANTLVNSLTLKLFSQTATAIQLAFLVATGVSACLNYLGMKFFVFRTRTALEMQ